MLKDKKTTLIVSICVLIVLVMLLILTTVLVQKVVFEKRIETLLAEIQSQEDMLELLESEKEFRKEWDYIRQKALEMGLLTEGELSWVESQFSDND